ncbi:unnamed protein product [Psylliodes chrysocephalus]|uniref:Short neuropeptide F n=1 Tax=Psylliodes chrysocephalus TaxID=3402493 RepID=A0A9P0D052_9CUCU|nr:unnamed protein product [Psylliodes chrysocephala]
MSSTATVSLLSAVFTFLVILTVVSTAPYSDYEDNIHDLVEILMQKQNMNEPLGIHQVERRRGPQLRLRFGKRTDEFDPFGINDNGNDRPPSLRLRFGKRTEEGTNERPASLRLRFGKRFDDVSMPVSGYSPTEGEN